MAKEKGVWICRGIVEQEARGAGSGQPERNFASLKDDESPELPEPQRHRLGTPFCH